MNTRELVNYLQGLAENNNRAWFVMNKPSYDILRAEFVELGRPRDRRDREIRPPRWPGRMPRRALFRINRDTSASPRTRKPL